MTLHSLAKKTGSVYMYYLSDDDVWKFSDVIENKGGEVWNMHDSSVSIDANSVVVRVPKNDVGASKSGSAFMYTVETVHCSMFSKGAG